MKINDLNQLGVGGAGGSKNVSGVDGRSAQQATSPRNTNRDDRAELSGIAEKVLDPSSETTPERAARIEQLRQDMLSGRYHADSTLTARGIVNDAVGGETK